MKKTLSFKLNFTFIILVTGLACNILPGAKTLVPDTSSSAPTAVTKEFTPPPSNATPPLPTPSLISSSMVVSPTEISPPVTVSPYDDFEDEKFKGTFDPSLFSMSFDSKPHCIVSQEDGVLRVQKQSEAANDFLDCSLSIERPVSVKSTRLENMYASILLKSDHQGNLVQTVLTVDGRFDDINTGWLAECGIWAFADGPFAVFAIQHIHKGPDRDPVVYHKEKPIRYDQWYRFGLEIEHSNSTLHCLVDDEELGNYSLTADPYATRLAKIRFLRWITNIFQEGTQATLLLDDFYLIPPR